MGAAAFVPIIAAGIQAGGNIAASRLRRDRGGGRSLFEALAPILEAEARRRAEILSPAISTPPFNPDEPTGVPGIDDIDPGFSPPRLGGLDILGLLRRQAFGGDGGNVGSSFGSFLG